MNYLAHAFLSGPNNEVLTGNMMGDSVKGNLYSAHYSESICEGILLHRFIDDFMDTHAVTKIGKKRIWPNYRHYSGVVLDLYYDHLLAKNWSILMDIDLQEFSDQIYQRLEQHWNIMPTEAKMVLGHMIQHNWLGNYISLDGIDRTFKNMSRRTKFISNMEKAVEDLHLHYDEYNEEFLVFFDDMRLACQSKFNIQLNG